MKKRTSLYPLLLLVLIPLINLINIPSRLGRFESIPSLIIILIAVSSSIFLYLIASKKEIKIKINAKKVVYGMIILYIVFFSTVSILKHLSFNSTAYDLGIYNQATWHYSEGRASFLTIVGLHILGDHVQPILWFIAPLYSIFPSAITLLIIQSIVLGLGALPLFWFVREKIQGEFNQVLLVASYLLYPSLHYMNLFDFHPAPLAITFFMFAFYFLYKDKYIPFAIFAVLGGITKEYFPAIVFMFGLYIVFVKKKWKYGTALCLVCLAWLYINFNVIVPSFRPEGYYYFQDQVLGGGITSFLSNPFALFTGVNWFEKIALFVLLFLPVGFGLFSLAKPKILFIAFPTIVVLTFIPLSGASDIIYHRTAELIPFLFLSAVAGIATLKRVRRAAPIFVFATTVLALLFYGPFTLLYDISEFNPNTQYVENGNLLIEGVPEDASIAGPNWVMAHFSQRNIAYVLPLIPSRMEPYLREGTYPFPEYIILDLSDAVVDLKRSGNRLSQGEMSKILVDTEYRLVGVQDTWVLFFRSVGDLSNRCELLQFLNKEKYAYLTLELDEIVDACSLN